METGICRQCGCNWITPCIDESHGACWWINDHRRLCSHCFYRFNDELPQMKVYYRSGHDWLEMDPEAYVAGLEHAKETKLMPEELLV